MFLSVLHKKYNVLDIFSLLQFDQDFASLKRRLQLIKKNQFAATDRIIINHFDTDYYIHNQYGINLINLFTVWKDLDLPLYVMLIYTNNIGIGQEIKLLCQHHCPMDQPTLFETIIDPLHYSADTYIQEPDINIEQIENHGLCLMGAPRSHRYALYNHLCYLSNQLVFTLKSPGHHGYN